MLCRTVAVVPRAQTRRVNRMWAMRKNGRVVGFSSQSARFVGVLHCETTPSARRRAHHAGRAASTALPRGVLRIEAIIVSSTFFFRRDYAATSSAAYRNLRYWHSRMAAIVCVNCAVFFSARSSRACVEKSICSCAMESNLTVLPRHSQCPFGHGRCAMTAGGPPSHPMVAACEGKA